MKKPGLISQAEYATGDNPFAASGGAQPTGNVFGQGTELDPEIQEVYDSAMEMVSELLHVNQQSSDGILKFIDNANTPQEGVAEATDLVLSKLEEAFDGKLPEEIILHLVEEITDLLVEMVEVAGIAEITGDFVDQAKILTALKIMEEYGVEQQDFESVATNVAPEDIRRIEGVLTGAKGAGTTE